MSELCTKAAVMATAREMAEQHRDLKQEMRRLGRSLWFRLGYKLGLV